MICCCTLAGTSACIKCNNRNMGKTETFDIVSVPYITYNTPITTELQDIKKAIIRLNERIDELLEENNDEDDDLGCPCPYESDYACRNCSR